MDKIVLVVSRTCRQSCRHRSISLTLDKGGV
jgi:hypothetical protein